jgi:hypothetical protein
MWVVLAFGPDAISQNQPELEDCARLWARFNTLTVASLDDLFIIEKYIDTCLFNAGGYQRRKIGMTDEAVTQTYRFAAERKWLQLKTEVFRFDKREIIEDLLQLQRLMKRAVMPDPQWVSDPSVSIITDKALKDLHRRCALNIWRHLVRWVEDGATEVAEEFELLDHHLKEAGDLTYGAVSASADDLALLYRKVAKNWWSWLEYEVTRNGETDFEFYFNKVRAFAGAAGARLEEIGIDDEAMRRVHRQIGKNLKAKEKEKTK